MRTEKMEKRLFQILMGITEMEIGGKYNSMLDGHIDEDEFYEKYNNEEYITDFLNSELLSAYERGYLQDELEMREMEAKHIKFLGKERIDFIILQVAENSLI